MELTAAAAEARPDGRRVLWRRGWRVARPLLTLGLLALAGVVLSSRSGELSGTATYLGRADLVWLGLAFAAETAAMLSFAGLQRRVLREGEARLGLRPLLAITLAGNAITNSFPAGPAFGFAYAYRQYRRRGVGELVSGWSLVAVNVIATAALAVLAAVGVAAAVGQGTAFDLVGVTVGTLVVAAAALTLLRRPAAVSRALGWALTAVRAVARRPRDPGDVARRVHDRLSQVHPSWPGLASAFGWALGNWALDLSCLVAAFGAVDAAVPWRGLLLAYGAAQLAANLPITPGGLGVVEGSLTIGLVAYGGAEPSSVAAVLLYRLFSFWGLLVVGWAVAGGMALLHRRQEAPA